MGKSWTIPIDPIAELLKAGRIVGLDPRQMLGTALRDLLEEQSLDAPSAPAKSAP